MKLPRREFLKTTLAASAATALTSGLPAAAGPAATAGREYYELRAYRVKTAAARAALDVYLEQAFLPALGRRGVRPVGVFTELEINREAATSTPKADTPVWVLIPHASLDSFVAVSAELNNDSAVQKAAPGYLELPKESPAFERIDSWLHLAFKGLPQMQVPEFSRTRVATRVFEMRSYESYSELKALAKMAMFNDGEIGVMKAVGMNPLFYGQALAGRDLPHLTYITCATDLKTHLGNWKKFSAHPDWAKMKDLPQYANTVSKNTPRFLAPTSYSQI